MKHAFMLFNETCFHAFPDQILQHLGIGEACAWQFAERGCNLIISGRREERLQALKAAIIAKFPTLQVHALKLDVQNLAEIEAIPASLPSAFKDVDVLVNNAGLALGVASAETTAFEDITAMINTNVTGLMV
jgi:NADP-dependent 3-hydroxy acid dehydrogenase YdfG